MSKNNPRPTDTIPEVQQFIEAEDRLRVFRQSNEEFFKYLDSLIEDYNDKLAAADKAVRAQQVSCGPFELYQYKTTYDADAMYDLLGRDTFLELGGKLETIQKRSIDKGKVDLYIKSGRIDKESAELIRKQAGVYHAPKPLKVP